MRTTLLAVLALLVACGGEPPAAAPPDADAARLEASADDVPLPDVAAPMDAPPEAAACPPGRTLVAGVCMCPVGIVECRGECVDTYRSALHCGGCNRSCRSDEACVEGRCGPPPDAGPDAPPDVVAPPDSPAPDAGPDACASSTVGNCCGVACPVPDGGAGATCVAGVCGFLCAAGRGDCDGNPANGCETDTATSASHCGACGAPCAAGRYCVGSACVTACPAGLGDCNMQREDGCETDLRTDRTNCGSCRNLCGGGRPCGSGRCI